MAAMQEDSMPGAHHLRTLCAPYAFAVAAMQMTAGQARAICVPYARLMRAVRVRCGWPQVDIRPGAHHLRTLCAP